MEDKIIPYSTYMDIEKGDVVVFPDDTRKVITHCNMHKVTFEDGSRRDLMIIQIKGIIKGTKTISDSIKVETISGIDLLDEEDRTPPKKAHIPLATSYKELNKLLYRGRDIEFYHLTEINNCVSIINSKYLYSRYKARWMMKYDNAKYIESTDIMTSSDRARELKFYARLYLNPRNGPTYSFSKSYKENNTFGVLIAFPFNTIWESHTQVILTPINSHFLPTGYFDWKELNIGENRQSNLKNYDKDEFDLNTTLSIYDSTKKERFTSAEIDFCNQIPTSLISHLYFKNTYERDVFLSKLSEQDRSILKPKCAVDPTLFWLI